MTEADIYNISYKGAYEGTKAAFMEMMAPIVCKKEAARLIGVSERTLHRMVRDGRMNQTKEGKITREEILRHQCQ